MFPVLFRVFDFPIYSYGFFIALGYLTALLLARCLARARGFAPADFSDLCLVAVVTGLIGARALYALTNFSEVSAAPFSILRLGGGGLVFYGGFLLALPAMILLIRRRELPLSTSLDILAPALALGHGIGRIGCFAAGCCHGNYCDYPWAVSFHTDLTDPALRGVPVHPVQLYESLGLFALSAGLLLWGRRRPAPGSVALGYLVGYALLRFCLEWFRGDAIRGQWAGLSTSQIVALFLFVGGGAFWVRRLRRNH